MLAIKEIGILKSIIKHSLKIEEILSRSAITAKNFDKENDDVQLIAFNILQIGELAKNLSQEFIEQYSKIPWRQIKGMRDKVAHGYGSLDIERLWKTALRDVKPLHDYCVEILNINNVKWPHLVLEICQNDIYFFNRYVNYVIL